MSWIIRIRDRRESKTTFDVGTDVAYICTVHGATPQDAWEKAGIIAAAPDLLAFVMRAAKADKPGDGPYWIELCEAARAALVKAAGV